jgi:hypothetical protein
VLKGPLEAAYLSAYPRFRAALAYGSPGTGRPAARARSGPLGPRTKGPWASVRLEPWIGWIPNRQLPVHGHSRSDSQQKLSPTGGGAQGPESRPQEVVAGNIPEQAARAALDGPYGEHSGHEGRTLHLVPERDVPSPSEMNRFRPCSSCAPGPAFDGSSLPGPLKRRTALRSSRYGRLSA